MGDEKKLLGEILSDAKARAEKELRRAEKEARDHATQAEKRLSEEVAVLAAGAEEHSKQVAEHARIDAALRRKRETLRMREAAVSAVASGAIAAITRERGAAYREWLAEAAAAAVATLSPADLVVLVNREDRAFLAPALRAPKGTTVDVREGGISAGVVVETADGVRRCDLSIESLAKIHERRIRREVSGLLFGEDGA